MAKKNVGYASANPAAVATAVAVPELYIVDLPVGHYDLGFEISGSPPRISNLSSTSPLVGKLSDGHYIHGIIMPDIVIDNLTDSNHLTELLRANVSGPRHIMVSSSSIFADPVAGVNHRGALYKHSLPINVDLGLGMVGFPPSITYVQPNSPLAGRVYPGQGVHALVIPGQPVFNLQAGAFTNDKVMERLASTSHIEGRQLVVKDGAQPKLQKGSNAAFDDCIIL